MHEEQNKHSGVASCNLFQFLPEAGLELMLKACADGSAVFLG